MVLDRLDILLYNSHIFLLMNIPSFQTFDEKLKPLELRITNLENKYVTFGFSAMSRNNDGLFYCLY